MSHKRKQPVQPSPKDQRIAELELELVRERAKVQRLRVNTGTGDTVKLGAFGPIDEKKQTA